MNTAAMENQALSNTPPTALTEAVRAAAGRIAPTWPLDRAIAVNPWWQMRDESFTAVAARLQALGEVNCLMPKDYYRALWRVQIKPEHLQAALKSLPVQAEEQAVLEYLEEDTVPTRHWHNVSDLLDAQPEQENKMAWRDEIVQQISQFCGLYFQYPERMQGIGPSESVLLYQAWLEVVHQDRGIEVLMGATGLAEKFMQLPDDPRLLMQAVYDAYGAPENFAEYCYALLLDVHGWASWLAYLAWQDAFENKENNFVAQLLAIRMAWDWVLWQQSQQQPARDFLKLQFLRQFEQYDNMHKQYAVGQELLWIWQRALEYSYQQPLHGKLLNTKPQPVDGPELQAVFCIDVRSEPMRRALEAQSDAIQTLGFAGFFGLPLEYAPLGGNYSRPQLPGLLSPAIRAAQRVHSDKARKQAKELNELDSSKESIDASPSAFGLVEILGLFKGFDLLKNTWYPSHPQHSINDIATDGEWELSQDGKTLTIEDKGKLAVGILNAMGLTENFAPTVLLLGHGSCTTNNPQAAALDCGACGGQTGEVNVKVLAQLLNDPAVRGFLLEQGISIPERTEFVAGIHNTTTDEIVCYGVDTATSWQEWLRAATRDAQKNRAASVGITEPDHTGINAAFEKRTRDWAQIRPEWALANNAAFIVAPRAVTRGIDLEGRSFLHDYQWQQDKGFGVLELIMTAPMIVTNWINLQYYASVVDNDKYGSGNKLLHNVVGGHIGVFEGYAGDLRIGLAKQSVHDGERWRHQPIRLNVYIAAPAEAMSDIIHRHDHVAALLNNDWLYLHQLDTEQKVIRQYVKGAWKTVAGVKSTVI